MTGEAPDWARACKGGSGARIRHAGPLVIKSERTISLRAEGEWLHDLHATAPVEIAARFPRVRLPGRLNSHMLVLEKLPAQNARRLALVCGQDITSIAETAVEFVFTKLFPVSVSRGDASAAWCRAHVESSLKTAIRARPTLREALMSPRVTFADGTIPNPLSPGLNFIERALAQRHPPRIGLVHGDLHLGNILLGQEGQTFYFVDPRGRFGEMRLFDPAYDVAKLLHEPQYIAARSRLVALRMAGDGGKIGFTPTRQSDAGGLAQLAKFALLSHHLATRACQCLRVTDLDCAARATLITGLLFLGLLRFDVFEPHEWETLLACGFLWLDAGIEAVLGGYGLSRCSELWSNLFDHLTPAASATAPLGLLHEVAPTHVLRLADSDIG